MTSKKPREERSKRLATVGMFLVVGITFLGVVLLGGVLMWGQRIRRLARGPLPKQSRDEFWYLHPNKQNTGQANSADEEGPSGGDPEELDSP